MDSIMTQKTRTDARPVTKMIVWGRAGGRCQYRHCHERLDGDLASGNLSRNKSYIAHIIAAAPGGERGDPVLSPALADDPSNLMLMCDAHHREIDDPMKLDLYTVEVLREMKREHEDRVDRLLSIRPSKASHILQVSAPSGTMRLPCRLTIVRWPLPLKPSWRIGGRSRSSFAACA
jgi:hypothetical protein